MVVIAHPRHLLTSQYFMRKSTDQRSKARNIETTQKNDKNEDASIPLFSVEDLDSSKQPAAGRIVAALMHVRVMKRHCFVPHLRQALSLFQNKPYNCFLYLKICNLLLNQSGKPRLKSYVNIGVGTHKFRSAVLVSGVPFRNQRWKNLNMFCRVNQVDRAQNCRPVYQNFGVPSPK